MSCRVIGRGIEDAFLASLAKIAESNGAKQIKITFIPTEKNKPAKDFIERHFIDYHLPVQEIKDSPVWITTKYGKI